MRWRRALNSLGLLAVVLAGAEIGARLDDWIRLGIPLDHTPNEEIDLRVQDSLGVHGRPLGQYRTWRLNNFGFRGPNMTARPTEGCTRILALGASETLGYYESPGQEFPAQLRDSLQTRGCYEVVNAGIPGFSLKAIIQLWERYASRFGATIVLIYPSPIFYLSVDTPRWPTISATAVAPRTAAWRPRILERLHNVIHTPDFIQRRREMKWIADDTHGKPDSWFFRQPPQDRLDAYLTDLDSLVKSVRAAGAAPVIMTHAMRFTIPAQPADDLLLVSWHHFTPRATPEAMLEFERMAAERTRDYAERQRIPLVDVDKALTGKSELFGDFIHFTDQGSSRVAAMIARTLTQDGLVSASSMTQPF